MVTIPQGGPISISVQWNLATTGGLASTQLAVDAINLLLEALFGVKLVSESSHEIIGITCKTQARDTGGASLAVM